MRRWRASLFGPIDADGGPQIDTLKLAPPSLSKLSGTGSAWVERLSSRRLLGRGMQRYKMLQFRSARQPKGRISNRFVPTQVAFPITNEEIPMTSITATASEFFAACEAGNPMPKSPPYWH